VSLRLRLLLAVGAVALTALAIADVVTYQELRSFLYSRIDQSLEQSHIALEGALGSRPSRGLGGGFPAFGNPRRMDGWIAAGLSTGCVDNDDDSGIGDRVDEVAATQLQRLCGPQQ